MRFVNYVCLKQYLAIQQKFNSKARDLTEISDTEQGIEAYYKFDLLKDILEYIECIEMNEDDFNHSQNILQQIEEKREALIQQFEKETDADGEEYDDAS